MMAERREILLVDLMGWMTVVQWVGLMVGQKVDSMVDWMVVQ